MGGVFWYGLCVNGVSNAGRQTIESLARAGGKPCHGTPIASEDRAASGLPITAPAPVTGKTAPPH